MTFIGLLLETLHIYGLVGRKSIPPKNVHTLISKTCDYNTLRGKRDILDIMKLRILKWVDYPGLSRKAQYNYKVVFGPCKREAGGSE